MSKNNHIFEMDFPSWRPERITTYPEELIASLGNPDIAGVYRHRNYMVELIDEETVGKIMPDFIVMKKADQKLSSLHREKKLILYQDFLHPLLV